MTQTVSEGGLEGLLPSPRAVHRRSRAMATSSVTSTISRLTGKVEWLGQISDALLAQSVIDRLKSAATRSCWEASLTANMKPGRPVRTAAPRPRRRY